MPAPVSATYSIAAKVAAHEALIDVIDSGVDAGYIEIRSASDALLWTIYLADPCGTVDGGTGILTFDIGDSEAPDAPGMAAYAQFRDSATNVHLSMPAQAGSSPVQGYLVLNTLTIIADAQITIISATVG